jgi:cysteine desulfurase
LDNTSLLAVPGIKAEMLVAGLDLAGIAVSAGAACSSSGRTLGSSVLQAMGVAPEIAACALRISFGRHNREEDVDVFLKTWNNLICRSRRLHTSGRLSHE